jgi:hypothetical protein
VQCEDHAANAEGQRENAKDEQSGLAEFLEVCRTILDHGIGPLGFPLPFWTDLTSSGSDSLIQTVHFLLRATNFLDSALDK